MNALINAAALLRPKLIEARATVSPRRFDWYPYDSLANAVHLTRLFELAGVQPRLAGTQVLDVGCADGDFSFCLESLGARVTAIDHPRSSQNGMSGVRALKHALDSPLELREMDIDRSFDLGAAQFETAFVLGLLYHVKNPFYVMETVARHARYCVVSTRVARNIPHLTDDVAKVPLAYLLGSEELNGDNSNFWIFSPAGLRRLFERSHWKELASLSVGDTSTSRPDTLEHDERIFCLLESTFGLRHIELLEGWHQPEDSGWRWTESNFSANLAGSGTLYLEIYVPEALIEKFGRVDFSCSSSTASRTYTAPGLYSFGCPVQQPGLVSFSTSCSLPATADDPRERALIVAKLQIE